MKPLPLGLAALGAAVLLAGVALIYVPAALILGGTALAALGLLGDF